MLDDLISRRWCVLKETSNSVHPGKIEHSDIGKKDIEDTTTDYPRTFLYPHTILPVFVLNTPCNIRSYMKSRKILKKIGVAYYYRVQIYATLLLLVQIGLLLISTNLSSTAEKHQVIGTAFMFFIFIAWGVLSMVHYGAESNDQVSRGIQHLHRQRMLLVEDYERREDLGATNTVFKNYQQIQAISIALNSAAKLLEEEWSRQPILIFGIRAGRSIRGLIASAIIFGIGRLGRNYIESRA